MSDWRERLTKNLEPKLSIEDPMPAISAYHDMPYVIFRYPPEDEYLVRREVTLLKTRLESCGKHVVIVSLASEMQKALDAELPLEQLVEAEKQVGINAAIDTVHEILSNYQPLDSFVIQETRSEQDPCKDIIFIIRTGALFPMYRASSLLEQLRGKILVPTVLFFPGELDGAAGLRFMGIFDAEHNYRPQIF